MPELDERERELEAESLGLPTALRSQVDAAFLPNSYDGDHMSQAQCIAGRTTNDQPGEGTMAEHIERARVAAHAGNAHQNVDRRTDWPLTAFFFTTVIALYVVVGLGVYMLVSAFVA